ncbi:MAG TPA: hypothetical protein DE045_08015 [Oceanospirillaceae bacterium]|nr:hypothetical protein [Oceanospirillaceae bacterium]
MKTYTGKCGCGDLEYSFEGEPINSVFCYCRDCQIGTGSDKWFGLWVPTSQFKFIKGSPKVYTRLGDSGKELHINFCSRCSTNICAEVTVGGFYSVAVSTLTGDHSFEPKMSIYAASAAKWAEFPEGVPKFDVLPPGMGG